ncbi:MAG: hypothetical protein ACLT76_18345 [Clostridium fessum]
MSLTAREWLLLPKQEQQRRGKRKLSSEECFKLRMDSERNSFGREEEKMKMTDEEKEHFIRSCNNFPKKKKKKMQEAVLMS